MTAPHRIDVHHHIVPPRYAAWLREKGIDVPSWSVRSALRLMDACQVRAAVLSLPAPGVWFGDPVEAERWARDVNEFGAKVVAGNPVRFGFFATLPLPDVPTAIKVAGHALDELGADGVVLAAGHDLGAPEFDPLLRHLHERRAVALVHPSESTFAADLLDTTRAAIGLIQAGALRRYPGIRFILANAGGFLPYVADRIPPNVEPRWSPMRLLLDEDRQRARRLDEIRQFYFDVALSSTGASLPSLLAVADPRRVVYGTDFPIAPAGTVRYMARRYDSYEMAPDLRADIDSGNARALFPRLSGLRAL